MLCAAESKRTNVIKLVTHRWSSRASNLLPGEKIAKFVYFVYTLLNFCMNTFNHYGALWFVKAKINFPYDRVQLESLPFSVLNLKTWTAFIYVSTNNTK